MSKRVNIDIQISIEGEDADTILKAGMERINQAAGENLQWEKNKSGDCFKTECEMYEENIMPALKELTEAYPRLNLYTLYVYDIREDDRSAQWWVTTQIYTERHADGTTTLKTESSTNWF